MVKSFSAARWVTVVGLVVAALGIVAMKLSGVVMPAVPPALVFLLVAAAVVAVAPWRWIPLLGVLAALAELGGFIAVGSAGDLIGAESVGVLVGNWARLLGTLTAVVAGATATWRAYSAAPAQGAAR